MIKTQTRNMHPSGKVISSNRPSQLTGWSEVVEVHWRLLCDGLNSFHCDEAFICAFPNRLSNINMHQISSTSPRLTSRKKSNIKASMDLTTYQLLLADTYPPKPNSFLKINV